jgi:hydroxylysine kinase
VSDLASTSPAYRLLEESGLGTSHVPVEPSLVSRILDERFGVTGRLDRLATEKDDTFRVRAAARDYLVKVSPPDEPASVIALQTAVMRFLQRTAPELPVQRVQLTLDGEDEVVIPAGAPGPRRLRVFDFVDGPVLAQTEPDVGQLSDAGELLGRIDVALAPFSHPAADRRLAWDLRHFHQLAELADQVTDAQHRSLAHETLRLFGRHVVPRLAELETQVIHGDYSPHNVVVDPHGTQFVVGVIDFGDTVRSAVIFDPAVCAANLLGHPPEQPWEHARAFLAGYTRTRPIRESELALLPIAALARLTLRALLSNWRATQVPERADYLRSHAVHDWINVERAIAVPIADVLSE